MSFCFLQLDQTAAMWGSSEKQNVFVIIKDVDKLPSLHQPAAAQIETLFKNDRDKDIIKAMRFSLRLLISD